MKQRITLFSLLMLWAGFSMAQGTARAQIVHNSGDAAADTVDVWVTAPLVGSSLFLDNVPYRTATAFTDVPAGVPLDVGIAPGNSTSVNDTIYNTTVTFVPGSSYIIVANGIVSASGYSPSPAFGLDVFTPAQEASSVGNTVDVLVHHGSTDAPAVDVVESLVTDYDRIVDDAEYGDFAGYLNLPAADFELQVRTATCDNIVAQYSAPLSTLGLADSAVMVVASGFLDPSANSNGASFGLFAVLPGGGSFIPLPTSTINSARVQILHNAADPAAATVDVYVNENLAVDDLDFRTSTPYIDLPAGTAFDVTIQPPSSTDTTNGLARFTYNLAAGAKYQLVANGLLSPTGFSNFEAFDIYVNGQAEECAETAGNTSVNVFHGATDAPTVDVVETSVPAGTIVDDLMYSSFTNGYLDLGNLDYVLDVRDENQTVTVATYQAPLQSLGLADSAITVLASGFLDPANNNNGEAFGLWAALPAGGPMIQLPIIVGLEDQLIAVDGKVFPNPTENILNIQYTAPVNGVATANIVDLNGRIVLTQEFGRLNQGEQQLQMNVNEVPTGLYLLQLRQGNIQMNTKLQIIH